MFAVSGDFYCFALIYLSLAELSLPFAVWAFLQCLEQGPSPAVMPRPRTGVASPVAERHP